MQHQQILHIAQPEDVQHAQSSGLYSCASLRESGFIHCCLSTQLAGVIERYYPQTEGLALLRIDPQKLASKLVYENTQGGDELFPHVYGEINMDAVLELTYKQ